MTAEQVETSTPAAVEPAVVQPQETAEAPTAEATGDKAEEKRTGEWVASIREKANRVTKEADAEAAGDDAGAEEDGGEVAAAAEGGTDDKAEAAAEAAEGEEKKPRRTLADLHEEHAARILKKQNEKLQQRLDKMFAVLEGFQPPADQDAAETPSAEAPKKADAAPEPAKVEDDPEPDFDLDPKDWHAWKERQFERRLAAQEESFQQRLLDQLAPLIEGGKLQQQTAQQSAEAAAAQARSQAIAREVATLVDEYRETAEGEGYIERIDAYANYFVEDLVARGASREQAAEAFQAEALDVMLRGESEGHHPVGYLDDYIMQKARRLEGLPATLRPSAGTAAAPAAPASQEAAPQPEAAKPAKSSQQQKAETDLAAAAAAAKLPEAAAGQDAVSAGPQTVDIRKMAQRGKVTGDMIEKVAKAQGRNTMAVVREMMRAANG